MALGYLDGTVCDLCKAYEEPISSPSYEFIPYEEDGISGCKRLSVNGKPLNIIVSFVDDVSVAKLASHPAFILKEEEGFRYCWFPLLGGR